MKAGNKCFLRRVKLALRSKLKDRIPVSTLISSQLELRPSYRMSCWTQSLQDSQSTQTNFKRNILLNFVSARYSKHTREFRGCWISRWISSQDETCQTSMNIVRLYDVSAKTSTLRILSPPTHLVGSLWRLSVFKLKHTPYLAWQRNMDELAV